MHFVRYGLTFVQLSVQRVIEPTRWGPTNGRVSLMDHTLHVIACRATMVAYTYVHALALPCFGDFLIRFIVQMM